MKLEEPANEEENKFPNNRIEPPDDERLIQQDKKTQHKGGDRIVEETKKDANNEENIRIVFMEDQEEEKLSPSFSIIIPMVADKVDCKSQKIHLIRHQAIEQIRQRFNLDKKPKSV